LHTDNIAEVSDYILIHGNNVQNHGYITEISEIVRKKDVYRPMPLVNNEDNIPWRHDNTIYTHGDDYITSA
jgi:hypothetical protein